MTTMYYAEMDFPITLIFPDAEIEGSITVEVGYTSPDDLHELTKGLIKKFLDPIIVGGKQ